MDTQATAPLYRVQGDPLNPADDASFPKAAEAVEVAIKKGALTLADRRLYNTLLAVAYPRLLDAEEHQIPMMKLRGSDTSNQPVKDSVQRLQQTLVEYNYFKRSKRHWISAQLLGTCRMNEGDGILYFTFPKEVRHFLYNPAVYARINLRVQNAFSSKYALVLYELLQLRVNAQATWRVSTEDLMRLLDIPETLSRFSNFKQRALMPAVADINRHTAIDVTCNFEKAGKKISAILFRLARKAPNDAMSTAQAQDLALGMFADPIVQKSAPVFTPTVDTDASRRALAYLQSTTEQERSRLFSLARDAAAAEFGVDGEIVLSGAAEAQPHIWCHYVVSRIPSSG